MVVIIYERIREECEKRGISIAKLEQMSGLGNATIRGWIEGSPKVETLKKVADALGMTLDELAGNK